jgi:hypothetical protein
VVPPALLVLRQPQVLLLLLEVVLLRVMQPHSRQAAAQHWPYEACRVA